jgi:hypothetical protein
MKRRSKPRMISGRADYGARRAKKVLEELGPAFGCRRRCQTRSWFSFGTGRKKPRSAPGNGWLAVMASTFFNWRDRYSKVNEHNGLVPQDFRLEAWEMRAIIQFHLNNR